MSRILLTAGVVIFLATVSSCGDNGAQSIDVANFDEFTFDRTIQIGTCFTSGDLINVHLTRQADNRLLTYTVLEAAGEEPGIEPAGADLTDCVLTTEEGECLVESDVITRVLVEVENRNVDGLFGSIDIANEPNELCGAGNVTLCSDDIFIWDGLTVSADFCTPVYVRNGFEVLELLEELRDGPPAEGAANSANGDGAFVSQPVDILRVVQISASDQLLGKNGDFTVIRTQSNLDGTLLQDGSVAIDFENEIAIAVVVIRAPCQEFTGIEATENLLWVEISGTLESKDSCGLDLGSIDTHLIVIPKSSKLVRLFLNGSELDEINL